MTVLAAAGISSVKPPAVSDVFERLAVEAPTGPPANVDTGSILAASVSAATAVPVADPKDEIEEGDRRLFGSAADIF